jgi:hypothetical protein
MVTKKLLQNFKFNFRQYNRQLRLNIKRFVNNHQIVPNNK